MTGQRERRTYRVRQLPSHVDRHQAVALLARLGPDLGPATNIQIFSLSSSLNPWEDRPTKTATVCFVRLPAAFDIDMDEWVLPAQSQLALERDIILDIHFLDFTALSSPEKHLVEYVELVVSIARTKTDMFRVKVALAFRVLQAIRSGRGNRNLPGIRRSCGFDIYFLRIFQVFAVLYMGMTLLYL